MAISTMGLQYIIYEQKNWFSKNQIKGSVNYKETTYTIKFNT